MDTDMGIQAVDEIVRRHATNIMLDHARDTEYLSIVEATEAYAAEMGLTPVQHTGLCNRIQEAISTARVTVEWPAAPTAPAGAWAELEVFGHRSHIGVVREVTRYGKPMVEVTVPARAGIPAQVHYYPGDAVFGEHPLTELTGWAELARRSAHQPAIGWDDECEGDDDA